MTETQTDEWLLYGSTARDLISNMRDQFHALDAMTCRLFGARRPLWVGTKQRLSSLASDLRALADDIDHMVAAGEKEASITREATKRLNDWKPSVFPGVAE